MDPSPSLFAAYRKKSIRRRELPEARSRYFAGKKKLNMQQRPVRSAARGLIIRAGKVLCNRYCDERGIHYGLPGGGQEPQEDLRETVRRECSEEAGCRVNVGRLLFVHEFVGSRHARLERHRPYHQVNHIFACSLVGTSEPKIGACPDTIQQGIEWIAIARLHEVYFEPAGIVPWLDRLDAADRPILVHG
jgi:ADP-ribose pyrophosphatase YjhB (NUDIX family)